MAITQKIIETKPETVWFVEETGANYRTEQNAKQALEDYLIKLERHKINALINEVLFGCVWVKHYFENALIRPDLNKGGWFKQADPSLKYNYESNATRGVLNFGQTNNLPLLLAKLIQDGVEVTFTGNGGESKFLTHDCQPGIIICSDKTLLALENKLSEELVKCAYEYCVWLRGQEILKEEKNTYEQNC